MQTYKISKELLSEVLGWSKNLEFIEICGSNTNILIQDDIEDISEWINIHDLAYKCKEWATFKNGRNIITERDTSGVYAYVIFMIGITKYNERLDDETAIEYCCKANTEPEAIFKSAQWILDNHA